MTEDNALRLLRRIYFAKQELGIKESKIEWRESGIKIHLKIIKYVID